TRPSTTWSCTTCAPVKWRRGSISTPRVPYRTRFRWAGPGDGPGAAVYDDGDDEYDDGDEVTTADRDTYIGILRCAENTTPPEPGVESALDLAVRLGSSGDTVDHLRHRALACPFPAASAP